MNAVYIGIGIAILLWISFNLHRKRKRRNKVIHVVENNCTGCRRCVKRCQHHVLEMSGTETKIYAAVKYPDMCTACGDCLDKCRSNALNLIERG
jgi:NAD-dependent dihydropyrimidine dehydrogenase PreA subunit